MKIANESSDTVEISKESLAALKKYNQTEVSAAAKKDSSSSSGYTYDYQSIKKKNLENIAAIEKEVAQKYGKKTDAADSTTKTADDKSTVKSDDSTKTASTTARLLIRLQLQIRQLIARSQRTLPILRRKLLHTAMITML